MAAGTPAVTKCRARAFGTLLVTALCRGPSAHELHRQDGPHRGRCVAVAAAELGIERACGAKARVRHRPEETVLHQTLSSHFEQFVECAEEAGGLPEFVLTEVREYLRCELLEFGLLHCRCQRCGHAEVCAFSCKRRGFCSSCLGRRMTDTALNLVERVLPDGVPVRQWVCSLPWRLRVLCGYDSALCADVMKAFEKEVSRSLQHRAKKSLGLGSVDQAHTGSVADESQSSGRRRPWAWMLRHVWQIDVSTCSRCGGAMKWVEVAPSPEAIARVLAELEHPEPNSGHRKPRQYGRPPPDQLRFGFG